MTPKSRRYPTGKEKAMTDAVLESRIRSIEFQLQILKAELAKRKRVADLKPRSLGDLRGIFAGSGSFSEAEIDAAQIAIDESKFSDQSPSE